MRNRHGTQTGTGCRFFDAEACVFVHHLMVGDSGTHRAQLDRFALLVRQGQSAEAAMEGAFGNIDTLGDGIDAVLHEALVRVSDLQRRCEREAGRLRRARAVFRIRRSIVGRVARRDASPGGSADGH